MDQQHAYAPSSCDGCRRRAFVLRVVDGANICDGCAEKSAEIDRQLAATPPDARVDCDECGDPFDFDAWVAVVMRHCGGDVLCGYCKVTDRVTA